MEHTLLIAITVDTNQRRSAHQMLAAVMPQVGARRHQLGTGEAATVTSWWVAEDDAIDGNDCDSAIFVPRGAQDDMRHVLNNYFDAHEQEWREEGYPYADTDVSGAWFRDTAIETSSVFGESHMVCVEYNTDADGREIDPGKEEYPRTFHGPFATDTEALAWIDAYPDDTDVHDITVMVLNNVQNLSRDRVTATGTCRHCGRAIVHTETAGWVDPEATGDDRVWRETCDQHDTFEARHEPETEEN